MCKRGSKLGKMTTIRLLAAALLLAASAHALHWPTMPRRSSSAVSAREPQSEAPMLPMVRHELAWACAAASIALSCAFPDTALGMEGASGENSKIRMGGASTSLAKSTARKIITRGVQLDGADFSSQDLNGVSFQQSQVRNGNFQASTLVGASFFDATLDDANFEGADLRQANLEMASLVGANLKGAVVTEAYVTGATSFKDANVEGADFTDTFLRKDQQKMLCENPTSKGTNPVTGTDTRDSLMCP